MLLKSAASPVIFGASPRFGALGLAKRLRFSCPALDGNVGNMALDLGRGFSSKYGCARTFCADGRRAGFNARRDDNRSAPAFVNNGNLALMTAPTFC